jgi:branched-chain amino acid transport system permease protein
MKLAVLGISVAAVLIMLPGFADAHVLHVAIMTCFFGMLALSWNFIGGMAGQMMLAVSLFVGIGAYVSSCLYVWYGLSPWIGMVIGAGIASSVAAIIGYVIFSRKLLGIYFALATLALSEVALFLALNWRLIGSANGFTIPPANSFWAFQFADKATYYYVALALVVITLLISFSVSRSRFGFLLAAVRENERTATSLGIDTIRVKIYATTLSAAIAAIAGTFYAQYVLFIEPESVLGIQFTFQAIIYTFVGGIGTFLGPLLGAMLMVPLSEFLVGTLSGQFPGLNFVLLGLAIIMVLLFAPYGVFFAISTRWAKYREDRSVEVR